MLFRLLRFLISLFFSRLSFVRIADNCRFASTSFAITSLCFQLRNEIWANQKLESHFNGTLSLVGGTRFFLVLSPPPPLSLSLSLPMFYSRLFPIHEHLVWKARRVAVYSVYEIRIFVAANNAKSNNQLASGPIFGIEK